MTDAPADKKDVVPSAYRDKYKETGGTNGDFIATNLQRIGKDGIESLHSVMAENGIAKDRWSAMNPGMQRMNLANVLRGTYLKGGTITLLGKQFNAKHQIEDFNGTPENTEKSLKAVADYLEVNDNERTVNLLRKLLFEESSEDKAAKRAEAKAATDAEKARTKDHKAAVAARAKVNTAHDKAIAAVEKADKAVEDAKANAAKLADVAKNAAEDKKAAAGVASKKANEKIGSLEDKAAAARTKSDEAKAALDAADAKVAALTPASA